MQTEESADLLILNGPILVHASSGKRFTNYIIDLIFFYVLIFLISMLLALYSNSWLEWINDDSAEFAIADQVITLILYGFYMSVMELLFKGKTLGKFITGTRAINRDGSTISAGTAFGRGFSKAVPFCAFSALSSPINPWQDRWTNTIVIDEKQTGAYEV